MRNHRETVIGFDARENWVDFRVVRSNEEIRTYFLTDQITKPLSVDVMVWNSIFQVLKLEIPVWRGPNHNLWEKRTHVIECIKFHNITMQNSLIAITKWNSADIEVSTKNSHWSFLGFDIADEFLLSGLMNSGYHAEEWDDIHSKWAPHLNKHHLFDDIETAFDFKSLTDQRVQEHAPFYVYGIYET